MVNTDFPLKKYTAVQYTQPASAISPLSKSTRHLLGPEPDSRYYYTHRAQQETITIDRDNLKQGNKFIKLYVEQFNMTLNLTLIYHLYYKLIIFFINLRNSCCIKTNTSNNKSCNSFAWWSLYWWQRLYNIK